MIKISTKSRYGLQAMVFLAKNRGRTCSLKEISLAERVPFDYLEKILGKLEKTGIIRSKKGPKGGYFLEGDLKKISVYRILEALEGPLALVFCISPEETKRCPNQCGCVTRNVWARVQNNIFKTLKSISLYELVEK